MCRACCSQLRSKHSPDRASTRSATPSSPSSCACACRIRRCCMCLKASPSCSYMAMECTSRPFCQSSCPPCSTSKSELGCSWQSPPSTFSLSSAYRAPSGSISHRGGRSETGGDCAGAGGFLGEGVLASSSVTNWCRPRSSEHFSSKSASARLVLAVAVAISVCNAVSASPSCPCPFCPCFVSSARSLWHCAFVSAINPSSLRRLLAYSASLPSAISNALSWA
mmetsp:Transcript_25623/g.55441  ORF Transcript_25623/g.55441 Transcript_25623/m.55441 type:complete len:223 (-) Transcript_25623:2342-3010(-)